MCFPASADSIPTSMGQEDHVSMGSISGRKAYQIILNVEYVLAIELLYALQAIDYRRPGTSSELLEKTHAYLRTIVAHTEQDRIFGNDIEALHKIIHDGSLLTFINETAKSLQLDLQ
jgi:histidine ammonia-lyase